MRLLCGVKVFKWLSRYLKQWERCAVIVVVTNAVSLNGSRGDGIVELELWSWKCGVGLGRIRQLLLDPIYSTGILKLYFDSKEH